MNLISIININQFLSLLVGIMPLSFMVGNMAININTILLILIPVIIYGKDIFRIKIYILDRIIISYFLLILVTGIINNIQLLPIYKSGIQRSVCLLKSISIQQLNLFFF